MGPARQRPEARLQLALDVPSLARALALASVLRSRLARVEVGTPLVLHSGVLAVEAVRSVVDLSCTVVADTKICDAGRRIAEDAFAAGADVVTVAGVAVDGPTWRGVLEAAATRPGAPGTVMIDTVGWPLPSAGAGLRELVQMASDTGVVVEICIHRPKHLASPFAELLKGYLVAGAPTGLPYLVAGQVVGGLIAPALRAGFGVVIVGGFVSDASDPSSVWASLLEEAAKEQLESTGLAQSEASAPA